MDLSARVNELEYAITQIQEVLRFGELDANGDSLLSLPENLEELYRLRQITGEQQHTISRLRGANDALCETINKLSIHIK